MVDHFLRRQLFNLSIFCSSPFDPINHVVPVITVFLLSKGPSHKYLEDNEVKYFSLEGEGVGDFMVTISLFQIGLHLTGLVFTIIG